MDIDIQWIEQYVNGLHSVEVTNHTDEKKKEKEDGWAF